MSLFREQFGVIRKVYKAWLETTKPKINKKRLREIHSFVWTGSPDLGRLSDTMVELELGRQRGFVVVEVVGTNPNSPWFGRRGVVDPYATDMLERPLFRDIEDYRDRRYKMVFPMHVEWFGGKGDSIVDARDLVVTAEYWPGPVDEKKPVIAFDRLEASDGIRIPSRKVVYYPRTPEEAVGEARPRVDKEAKAAERVREKIVDKVNLDMARYEEIDNRSGRALNKSLSRKKFMEKQKAKGVKFSLRKSEVGKIKKIDVKKVKPLSVERLVKVKIKAAEIRRMERSEKRKTT